MRALFVTMPLLVASTAFADVNFEVADHGDTVEVIAHGVTARSTNVSSIRSRLEVPLAGNPLANKQLMADPTVLQVELDGVGSRVLSVKTRLDRPEVHSLAPLAKAEQIGDDLHLTFPRHASKAVPATTTKIVDAKVETKPDDIKIEPKAEAKIEAKPEAKPEAKIEQPKPAPMPAVVQPIAPPPAPPAAAPAPSAKLQPSNEPNNNIVMYGAAGILALLAGAYIMRKKKQNTAATSTIEVVAQRALGNKAKVMWLAAGTREILVSVTNQNVRMLGQWPRTQENAAPLPTARLSFAALDTAPALPASSPSVAGLVKLRAQTQGAYGRAQTVRPMPQVNEDVATDDEEADLEWAKEILTATGGRR